MTLTELATGGERKSWSGYGASYWAVVLSMSAAGDERFAPDEARPPLGATPHTWSGGVRRRLAESLTALGEATDVLARRADEDPGRHLPELVRRHRVRTVRSAVHWESRTHLFAERVRPLFDEGVALARRLSGRRPAEGTARLVTALTDRATFRTAAGEFEPALTDFREALRLLGEEALTGPPPVPR